MDELIQGLVSKVGLDEAQAKKVVSFLQDNADQIPKWLGSLGSVTGALGIGGDEDLLGGVRAQVERARDGKK
jgi:hypothetical protein